MKSQSLKPALRELAAKSEKLSEMARGDFLRAAAAKFPDHAPALDDIQNPFQVAPRGKEWRAGFLRWARKRGLRSAIS